MKKAFHPFIGFIAAVTAALGVAGCGHLRPVSSTPPVTAVVVSAPFTIDQLSKATFPPGEYRPLYEDNGGFYYQAPAKIVANALFSYMYDGGLYVKRGETNLTQWYVVSQGGMITRGQLKTEPPHEFKP
jgi:hypothetical protein